MKVARSTDCPARQASGRSGAPTAIGWEIAGAGRLDMETDGRKSALAWPPPAPLASQGFSSATREVDRRRGVACGWPGQLVCDARLVRHGTSSSLHAASLHQCVVALGSAIRRRAAGVQGTRAAPLRRCASIRDFRCVRRRVCQLSAWRYQCRGVEGFICAVVSCSADAAHRSHLRLHACAAPAHGRARSLRAYRCYRALHAATHA